MFFVAAELKKPLTKHTRFFNHCVMQRMHSIVHYVKQLLQHSSLDSRFHGAFPTSEPDLFISLFSVFESLALMAAKQIALSTEDISRICSILLKTLRNPSFLKP